VTTDVHPQPQAALRDRYVLELAPERGGMDTVYLVPDPLGRPDSRGCVASDVRA
jgi:hypothetical protein